jgi:transposase
LIVIGVDAHKHTHTAAAADAGTARHLTEITISARPAGLRELLTWALGLDVDRLWAIEDCRHVSGALERMLLAAGERVVRVAPKLMANQRKAARQRGKSDAIDALAIARAAIREPDLPIA